MLIGYLIAYGSVILFVLWLIALLTVERRRVEPAPLTG